MSITALPTPPSRADAANFSTRADAFFAALPLFVTEMNANIPDAVGGTVTGAFSVSQNCTLGSASTNTVAIQSGSAALPALVSQGDLDTGMWFPSANSLGLSTGGVERMRLVSSGDIRIGLGNGSNTVGPGLYGGVPGAGTNGMTIYTEGDGTSIYKINSYVNNTADRYHIAFYTPSGLAGYIKTNGLTVGFVSVSDYRLKRKEKALTGSGAFIDALQPKTWEWIPDGSTGVGFIAHELQTVSPRSVAGAKDAKKAKKNQTDADVPDYQGVEYGSPEMIANIVAELQSLRSRVAALEAG